MRLNLGCSDTVRVGADWCNVDIVQPCDQVVDLALPWPWDDSSVDEIYAADIFEHIGDCNHLYAVWCSKCDPDGYVEETPRRHWSGRIHAMNESWRVLRPGGLLTMECPDAAKGAGQWQDPTHVTPWTPNGLQYFQDGSLAWRRFHEAYGITARFRILSVTERKYEEMAGAVRCEVWKFAARMEACK